MELKIPAGISIKRKYVEKVRQIAKEKDTTVSSLIEEIIEFYLKNSKNVK